MAGSALALNALAKDYGRKLEWSGPLYESMKVEGPAIRLRFSHADGLMAKGGGPLNHFLVAGDDLDFVPAEARIDDGGVVVSSAGVPHPVAVRYAWQSNPEGCNLANAAGLPASPFCTDTADTYGKPLPLKGGDFAYPYATIDEKESAQATGWTFQRRRAKSARRQDGPGGERRPAVPLLGRSEWILAAGDPGLRACGRSVRRSLPAAIHRRRFRRRELHRHREATHRRSGGGFQVGTLDKPGGGWTSRGLSYVAKATDRGKPDRCRIRPQERRQSLGCVLVRIGVFMGGPRQGKSSRGQGGIPMRVLFMLVLAVFDGS